MKQQRKIYDRFVKPTRDEDPDSMVELGRFPLTARSHVIANPTNGLFLENLSTRNGPGRKRRVLNGGDERPARPCS